MSRYFKLPVLYWVTHFILSNKFIIRAWEKFYVAIALNTLFLKFCRKKHTRSKHCIYALAKLAELAKLFMRTTDL